MTMWAKPRWNAVGAVRWITQFMKQQHKPQPNWMAWALAVLAAPLLLLLIETVRGAVHEAQMVRTHHLQASLQALHAEAAQKAIALETVINRTALDELPLTAALTQSQIAQFWLRTNTPSEHRLYAAVVDPQGTIVLHTDAAKIGSQLGHGWYDTRLPDYGSSVTYSRQSPLSGEHAAYDVSKSLAGEQTWGEYHEGLDAAWLEKQIAAEQRTVLGRWSIVLAIVLAVDIGAGWSLVKLARALRDMKISLAEESRKRALELSQIGSGLAHEVRNPLHALRINLHTLRRALSGRSSLPPDQLVATVDESDAAIDRLDELMRDFLQFSDPTSGNAAPVDLVQEVQATLRLLAEDFRRSDIRVEQELAAAPICIAFDPHRLRQVLLNLLTFAQHRAGKSGTIRLRVTRQRQGAELAVSDSGPVLPERQREKLFEPFQAPVETGSGLGLALVQAFVEEAGGRTICDGEGSDQGRCRVWLPLESAVLEGNPS